jgi:predicted nucleic acid-binding Zn ribbon protein
MAAIRSGKAGFLGGIYSHVHRPEGRAPAGPAVRCTCVYTAIEAGMQVPHPAGDTAWKCAGFRAPMAAIRSGKAGFWGIYSHVHRPQVRAPAGPAVRCTCVYTAIEAGMPVPRPAGDTAWKCAEFSGRLRRQFRAVKRVFWGAFTRMYTGRKCEPQLALRSDVHACTRQKSGSMPVPRPAGDTAWKCAEFSGRLRRQFRAVKRVFWGAFTRMYTGRKGGPSRCGGPVYMRVHGDRGRNAGSTPCRRYGMEMRRFPGADGCNSER